MQEISDSVYIFRYKSITSTVLKTFVYMYIYGRLVFSLCSIHYHIIIRNYSRKIWRDKKTIAKKNQIIKM